MSASKKWAALKKGDIVDVVAPGFRCTDLALEKAVKFVETFGLKPRVPKNIFGDDLICANTDKERLMQLKKALYARDSKAVWCVRAGYGSIRLMPQVQKWKAPARSKLFIGYSDVTTLHYFFNTKWSWPTLHGPLLDRLGEGRASATELHEMEQLLFGQVKDISYLDLVPLNKKALAKTTLTGKIVGGNMSVVTSSQGTPHAVKAKSKILFLEDWGERAYSIDRMLNQLEQSKAMDGIKALILGDFIGGKDKDGVTRVWPIWKEFAERVKFPVLKGLQAGHGDIQRPLPLGTKAELELGNKIKLKVLAGSL